MQTVFPSLPGTPAGDYLSPSSKWIIDVDPKLILYKHIRDSPAHQSYCRNCNRTFVNRQSLNQHLTTSSRHSRSLVLFQGSAGRNAITKVSPAYILLGSVWHRDQKLLAKRVFLVIIDTQFFPIDQWYHFSNRPPLSTISTTSIVLSVANRLVLHLRLPSTSSQALAITSHAIILQLLFIRWELFLPYPSLAVWKTEPAHRSLFAP